MFVRALGIVSLAALLALTAAVLRPEPVYTHKPITTNILFKNEIAQIFQRKCFQCHSDNNLSMSLTNYTEARPWAQAIREEILDREMPPWQAVPGYGRFANDLSLNAREKEIILSWTDGGAPSGVPRAEEPIPPVYVPPAPEWDHGAPNLVLPVAVGHAVPAGAPFTIKRFVVDTKLPAAQRVHAIALKQGDRRVVRHASFYDAATGQWLGAWTPWYKVSELAQRSAVLLPAKARIAVEIGYVGTETDVTDASELGLYFDTAKSAPLVSSRVLTAGKGTIAARSEGTRVRSETIVAANTAALALWVDPSDEARSIEITAVAPDGLSTPLLWIQQYRHDWRSPFFFQTPVPLVKGTRLVMTTYFDNPSDAPVTAKSAGWLLTAPGSAPAR